MKKIALFELSTTAIRLTLAAMVENEYFYVYKEFNEYIRINEHIEKDGLIKTAKIKECIALLQIYKKICEAESVGCMHCIAAASLSEAKNYSSFLDEANNTCGLEFKMLTDAEEVNAVYTGAINTLDVPKGVIVNISSYSTRIIHYNRRVVLDSVIIPYGSASLFKEGGTADEASAKVLDELNKKGGFLGSLDAETALVGVSDVFVSFGRLSRKMRRIPIDIDHNFHASTENFQTVFEFVKGLDVEKKKKLKGISSHSADTILAGMCIMDAILQYSKLNNIIVGCGYRNIGLLFNYALPFTLEERPVSDVLGYSLDVIAASAGLDKKECDARYNLALLLFRQLKVLHKLPRGYLKVLRVASYLYHLGKRINNFNYEKINYYAILNCNLCGLSHKEIVLSAFTAAQKKWEDFNLAEWVRYKDIVTDDDLEAVRKLSIIVAMAEALNIRNCSTIKDISCDILGDSVILKLIADESAKTTKTDVGALHMEIFYAKKYSTEFVRAFKKNLEIL